MKYLQTFEGFVTKGPGSKSAPEKSKHVKDQTISDDEFNQNFPDDDTKDVTPVNYSGPKGNSGSIGGASKKLAKDGKEMTDRSKTAKGQEVSNKEFKQKFPTDKKSV
jgi:hypothetical protein